MRFVLSTLIGLSVSVAGAVGTPGAVGAGGASPKISKRSTALPSGVKIGKPYIYQPMEGVGTTAGYFTYKNETKKAVKLSVVKAEGFKAAETHETLEKDGRMQMVRMDNFEVKPGETLELTGGGKHIMLFGGPNALAIGALVNVTLKFDSDELVVPFEILPRP